MKKLALSKIVLSAIALSLAAPLAWAQTRVEVEPVTCLPVGENGVVTALVNGEPGGSMVRYYFRRLHEEVEDFYYVEMQPQGGGRYWTTLPQAEDEKLDVRKLQRELAEEQAEAKRIIEELGEQAEDNPQAAWWVVKERIDSRDPNEDLDTEVIEERAQNGKLQRRDWMLAMTLPQLEQWLEDLEFEPTEVYATVVGPDGREIARSKMAVIEVTSDCDVKLDERQEGQAENMVVGETAPWEEGKRVFHWECDGIVTRRDYRGVLRADDVCRTCVVAWWGDPAKVVGAAAGVTAIVGIIDHRDPTSPSEP